MEYGGMCGVIGLKYEALKDFVRWGTLDGYDKDTIAKEFVPLLLSLGRFYASCLNQNSK